MGILSGPLSETTGGKEICSLALLARDLGCFFFHDLIFSKSSAQNTK